MARVSLTVLLQCYYNCTSGLDLKPGGKRTALGRQPTAGYHPAPPTPPPGPAHHLAFGT